MEKCFPHAKIGPEVGIEVQLFSPSIATLEKNMIYFHEQNFMKFTPLLCHNATFKFGLICSG